MRSTMSLQQVAGVAAWERGRRYAASGAVVPLSERSPLEGPFAARVAGARTYDTEVRIDGDTLEGRCDCPQGDGDWFCKHQVAVAIVWRQRLTGEGPEIGAEKAESARPPASRLRATNHKREALHHFLGAQDVPTLARKLLEIADGDRVVTRELLQWQKIADAADRQDLVPTSRMERARDGRRRGFQPHLARPRRRHANGHQPLQPRPVVGTGALERTDAARRRAWLEALRTEHKAKCRFIERLPIR